MDVIFADSCCQKIVSSGSVGLVAYGSRIRKRPTGYFSIAFEELIDK